MSKLEPLVSIITPYYNAPDFFREALQSLQQQSYKNFELVVVDDASPGPDVEKILAEFAFSRVKFIRHETNTGPQTARNTAVLNSVGDYILSFDCDDKLEPDYLRETVSALKDDTIHGAYTQLVFFGEKELVWTPDPSLMGVMTGSSSGPNTFLYRREVYDAVGGYNTKVYCSDASLWLSALSKGYKFKLIDKPLMQYRVRSEGRLARLTKHEHVPNLAAAFPELYAEHMVELLRFQEERYFSLLEGFHSRTEAHHQLLLKMQELETEHKNLEASYLANKKDLEELKSKYEILRPFEGLAASAAGFLKLRRK